MGISTRGEIEQQHIPEWKEERLKQISKDTLQEVLNKLEVNRRVLAVRPTGFGKSYMLAGITSSKDSDGELRYKKCLYVYPTNVIKQDVVLTYSNLGRDERAGMLQNTTFISYKKLTDIVATYLKGETAVVPINLMYAKRVKNKNTLETERIPCDEIYEVGNKLKSSNIVEISNKIQFRKWIREFDLIMLDECHKIGAPGFQVAWKEMESVITEKNKPTDKVVKLVGVTATPKRLDGVDIRDILGKQNEISKLTMNECIAEGLLQKFDYVYAIGDRQKFLNTTIDDVNNIRKQGNNEILADYEINELITKMNKIPSVPDILKQVVKEEHTGGNNYAKFVVFFRDKNHIARDGATVERWFNQAYPDMDVQVFNIVTKAKSTNINYEIDDIETLEELKEESGVIHLIFCVDKLNMGYHVESITGVVLLRETASAVIYNQQIGRCFSVRSMNKPIIIDLVDKSGAGSILDRKDKLKSGRVSEGEKRDLMDALDEKSLDVTHFAHDVLEFSDYLRTQDYSKIHLETVRFLYYNRKAPFEVISSMTKLKISQIKKMIEEEE